MTARYRLLLQRGLSARFLGRGTESTEKAQLK